MLRAMLIKEFILLFRDKYALAALFVMPAIFILIMSLALKDTLGSDRVLSSYVVVDQDQTAQSARLQSFLAANRALAEDAVAISNADQRQQALNGTVQFVLSIPQGFSQNLGQGQSGSALLQLTVAADVKQEVVTLFQGELTKGIMRLRLEKMEGELAPFLPEVAQQLEAMDFAGDGLVEVRFNGMAVNEQPTSTQQSVPSWIVFGMFFVIIPMSTVFINERRQNTLMRMGAMNITVPLLFAGKIAPYMLINQIQVWLMIAVGIFVVPLCGGDALTLGDSITGLFMVSLGLSLAAIGTSVLIAVLASTVEQATTIGGIINILLGAIGGIMVPKFYMPQAMQDLSNISPMSWGLEGFLDIFLRGLGAEAVLLESLALAGFGAGLLLVAGMVFSSKMRRGA
ncbi:MAG: ABC transporter permease [Proteobacteria bacterium]|nr:ABC transporter permease [Pseudomonadota bacterium]MBU1059000.1 ABC transporter permease [Pseudomonadota bacterium]